MIPEIPDNILILFVEDNAERIEKFKKMILSPLNTKTVYARSGGAALTVINKDVYDFIFLDYDLGYDATLQRSVTGLDVAKKLSQTRNRNATVIVHTMNLVAGAEMVAFLKANNVRCLQIPYEEINSKKIYDLIFSEWE